MSEKTTRENVKIFLLQTLNLIPKSDSLAMIFLLNYKIMTSIIIS